MAVPKKRTTATSKRQRRSHDALSVVTLSVCANCKQSVRPHTACGHCGFYRGKKVLSV
jgi:large subunit ribosomal protein L32